MTAQHMPEYTRRGAQSGFWHCRCSCGWSYPGAFATSKRTVSEAHKRHVAAAIAKATGSAA